VGCGVLSKASEAMKALVPITGEGTAQVMLASLLIPTVRAKPKSVSLVMSPFSSEVIKTFSGFKSRKTIFFAWRYSRARSCKQHTGQPSRQGGRKLACGLVIGSREYAY